MKHINNLTETEIKEALKNGHITQMEARQMLMVYLRKADFAPMQHLGTRNIKRSFSSHY